jgi:cytoskeletal protein CcmA (bactofilin family)
MSSKNTNEMPEEVNGLGTSMMVSETSSKSNNIKNGSSICSAVHIKGEIAAEENLFINGRIEGIVALRNHTLEIGKKGFVDANTFAQVIIIGGEIKGDIYASERVIIKESGRVCGNIFSPDISIDDGAVFKGAIDMTKQSSIPAAFDSPKTSISTLLKKVQEIAHFNPGTALTMDDAQEPMPEAQPVVKAEKSSSRTQLAFEKSLHADLTLDKSYIGETVTIKGDIVAESDMVIDGTVDGIIYFKNNNLEIGSSAHIHSNIFGKCIINNGEVRGDLYANEHVTIKKEGKVLGKIFAPRFSIESGAVVKGNVTMEKQDIEKVFSNIQVKKQPKEEIIPAASSKHTVERSKDDSKTINASVSKDKLNGGKKDFTFLNQL